MTARPSVAISNWVHPEVLELLRTHAELIANDARESWSRERALAAARDADAYIAFMTDRVDEAFLAACPRLRLVACALKGYDNFDLEACTRRGVWLSIVPDLLTAPTAELTVGLMIACARKLLAGDRFVRSGAFQGWRPCFYGRGLAGSVVGIAGMGAVGQAVAERLAGFGAQLRYHDARPLAAARERALGVTATDWDTLLGGSDFLVLALPLDARTLHCIDAAALARMKPDAYLINPCRGSVVDEQAVATALASKRLAGYAADVFEMEDWARSDRPLSVPQSLRDDTRTLLTPHLGSAVDAVRRDIALAAAHNVLDLLAGRRPRDAINAPAAFAA